MSTEPTPPGPASSPRISFERLRERTDELELIISGLCTVALLSLPEWLLDRHLDWSTQLPPAMTVGVTLGLAVMVGLAYVLGGLFALHLGIRAYWVGLIGLKTVFPQGIQWDKASGTGPILRERLRQTLPDIDTAIDAADRMASILFASITLAALMSLWIGVMLILVFGGMVMLGLKLGLNESTLDRILTTALLALAASALGAWLLDAWLSRHYRDRQVPAGWRRLVLALADINRVVTPERLISPVMLTLQTNSRPRLFALGFLLAIGLVPLIGSLQLAALRRFDSFGSQVYFNETAAREQMRSLYYESLRIPQERANPAPLIPAPVNNGDWLPVFLPYSPLRDDALLKKSCGRPDPGKVAPCLRRLWRIELNGQALSTASLFAAERRDLGFRGLQGYLPLQGLKPGPQVLSITWNAAGKTLPTQKGKLAEVRTYHIPFVWDPQAPMP